MKNILMTIFLAGLLSLSMTSFSQVTLKIGHVDLTKIMESLPERDTAAAVLQRETKEVQSTYDEMTVVYNKLLDDYDKGKSTYSEIIRKTKETELLDKEKRIQEFEQNAQTNLQKRNSELVQPILDKVLKAVNKVAAENGFTYILDVSKGSVIYTSKDSQNINELVLKMLKPL
jgi:outer membrane protein